MSAKPTPPQLIRAADRGPEQMMKHPMNPNSELHGYRLSRQTGLQRVGVNLVRIPPGKESFIFHSHSAEEEFLYILSGRGIAEIGDGSFEVGPGDFMGFPTPSVGHHMRNPFNEDLVYLSGGESRDMEVADFPRLGKRLVRVGQNVTMYPQEAGVQPFGSPPSASEKK